jgi:hypothetical protein
MHTWKQSNNNNNNNVTKNFIKKQESKIYTFTVVIPLWGEKGLHNNNNNNNNNNSIQFLYLSACLQRVAYNRRELKVCITKARVRLAPELELD